MVQREQERLLSGHSEDLLRIQALQDRVGRGAVCSCAASARRATSDARRAWLVPLRRWRRAGAGCHGAGRYPKTDAAGTTGSMRGDGAGL